LTGGFPNHFSLALKHFLINLRLVPGDSKTRLLGSNSWNRFSFTSPRFMDKKRFNERSKRFTFGKQPVEFGICFKINSLTLDHKILKIIAVFYEFKIIIIVAASMLPPLIMIPARPLGMTVRLNSAASPSAPEGSTTNFIR
jgi:hypothetical protein